jgi:hypothetical protein
MANTFSLIASNTLTGLATDFTFSSIPQTYTDLLLRANIRDNNNGVAQSFLVLQFNGVSTAVYSRTVLRNNNGNTAISTRSGNVTIIESYPSGSGSTATANAFSPFEMYIPNYTSTSSIPFSTFGIAESNVGATIEAEGISAGLWRGNAAITSIYIDAETNFVAGSSFFLYGIKNT